MMKKVERHTRQKFKLKVLFYPEGHDRYNPFYQLISKFDDMPSSEYYSRKEAEQAAKDFIEKYIKKNSKSAGGYNEKEDSYWIRYSVDNDKWKFTNFYISIVDDDEELKK